MKRLFFALLPLLLSLTACDQVNQRLGLEDPAKKEARQDGEGRAVGSACRQSGRAIEDCYAIYYWLPKASIFAGWREMNDYMVSNKLEVVRPQFEPPGSPEEMRKKRKKQGENEDDATAAKADGDKGSDKSATTGEAGKGSEKSAEKSAENPATKPEASGDAKAAPAAKAAGAKP